MTKAMSYREVKKALVDRGCRARTAKGSHEVWYCPDETPEHRAHFVAVPAHRIVSPGVIRDLTTKLACLPEGWLQ